MPEGYEGGRVQILIVEDNPLDVDLIRLALRSAQLDCDLIVIDDGAKALAFVRRQGPYASMPAPRLAVLDLNLPKHDGLEVLQAMRISQSLAELPVAILSSSSSPRERAIIERFPPVRYITKPADLDEYLKIGFILKDLVDGTGSQTSEGSTSGQQ